MTTSTEVLVVGAGPVGLVTAISLAQQGIKTRVVDREETTAQTSRALLIHSRTLELYQQIGLTDEILKVGDKLETLKILVEKEGDTRLLESVSYRDLGKGITPYPYIFILPQDKHEPLLERKLNSLGVFVERRTEFVNFDDHGTHVTTGIRRVHDGSEEAFDVAYLIGCDGSHSPVRHGIRTKFSGGKFSHLFYTADIEIAGSTLTGEAYLTAGAGNIQSVFPTAQDRLVHVTGTTRDIKGKQIEDVVFDDIKPYVERLLGMKVCSVNWFSAYRVQHRLADEIRHGRIFLAGDAAHILGPLSGQGMNAGIADGLNLGWKVASVLRGKANDSLLDTYQLERKCSAAQVINASNTAFDMLTEKGFDADAMKKWLLDITQPVNPQGLGGLFFRLLSQTWRDYRYSPLAAGQAGEIHGGDRLPWVKLSDGRSNYTSLSGINWRVHVYGMAKESLIKWCQSKDVELDVFAWDEAFAKADLVRDAVYLTRPDTFIALVIPPEQPEPLEQLDKFLSDRGLKL